MHHDRVMQGGVLGSDVEVLNETIAQVCNCAAWGSIVLGSMVGRPRSECENVLASSGLLGTVIELQDEARRQGRLPEQAEDKAAHTEVDLGQVGEEAWQWLFTSQHQRLSLAEMGTYSDHVGAAEEVDEDFFGNFS